MYQKNSAYLKVVGCTIGLLNTLFLQTYVQFLTAVVLIKT